MITAQKLSLYSSNILVFLNSVSAHIFVPTHLEGGGEEGEELYTQMHFFVQSVLAVRYIHRRELRLVSLESLSSVEYGNKKSF